MPNTVAQHAVATFTSPVNGTTPIDANSVRGNDNTLRSSYNNHDADPGVHVQSSTLASRPAAGTAGRKWITADAGSYKLWYDDGSSWNEIANASLNVFVVAGENLVKGDIIKVTGYNTVIGAPTVAKITAASDVAFGLVTGTITSGSTGYVANMGLVTDVATNAFSIGNTLYPNTSGGLTSTKPTSGTYQPVAYVLRSDLTNGVLYVEFSSPRIVERSDNTVSTLVLRDASGNFAAGTVTAALTGNASTATTLQTARNINGVSFNGSADITVTAAAGTLTGSTLASGVTASSLTSVGTLTSLAVSGNLTVDTNTLFVDATNDRVGIGTASPTRLLTVATSAMVNSNGTITSGFYDGLGISGYDAIGWYGSSVLAIGGYRSAQWGIVELYTAGAKRVTLNGNGNLGIGVTPSAWSTYKAVQLPGGSLIGANEAVELWSNAFFDGAVKYVATAAATRYNMANGAHAWYTAPSGTAGNAISFTERLRVDATTTAGQTALLLWDVDNGTLERVTVGAADSAGVGFKVLRIPN